MGNTFNYNINNIKGSIDSSLFACSPSEENTKVVGPAENSNKLSKAMANGDAYAKAEAMSDSVRTPKNNYTYEKNAKEFSDYLTDEKTEEEITEEDILKAEEDAAKELKQKISEEDIKKLEAMGIDVENVRMTSLLGMVNTIHETENLDEMRNQIKEIGIESKLEDGIKLSGKELLYVLKNNLPITEETMYKAHFSGAVESKNAFDANVLKDMSAQIEEIAIEAGIDVTNQDTLSEVMEGADYLLSNDLPVSGENLRKYVDFQNYIGKSISEIDIPESVEEAIIDKAEMLYDIVNNISDEGLTIAAQKYSKVTLQASIAETKYYEQLKSKTDAGELGAKEITAMRQMEEIRLRMTVDASVKLAKLDMSIDTKELNVVVEALKKLELEATKESFRYGGVEPTEENLSLFNETRAKVNEIASADIGLFASLHREIESIDTITVNRVYDAKVAMAYEAVGTEVRRDLGDSIAKAFGNIEELLNENGIEYNYETERATKILAQNQLEITQENIDSIVAMDREVNELINNFYPEAVIGMIRDGINPLTTSIPELNKTLRAKNYNEGVTDAKNFATYLRDLEAKKEITAEERESYIGIYRLANKLQKDGNRELGYIFANDARLTANNILTAMQSIRDKGIDASISDEFGMLDSVVRKDKTIGEQISSAFETKSYDELEVDADFENMVNDIANISNQVNDFMLQAKLEYTAINVTTVESIVESPFGIYGLLQQAIAKLKATAEEENIRELNELGDDIEKSLRGEDIPIELGMESILEKIAHHDSDLIRSNFEDIRDSIINEMYQQASVGVISSTDIAVIKSATAGLNIMGQAAPNNRYQIPVETSQGIRVMNLTINKASGDIEMSGTIEVSIKMTEGLVEAKLGLAADGKLSGSITGQTSEQNEYILSQAERVRQNLAGAGLDASEISFGQVAGYYGESSERVYQVATDVVRAISMIFE